MEYRLRDGSTVTDEELERDARAWESGDWEGRLEPVRVAVPERDADSDGMALVSFRIPGSRARAVEAAAKRAGISKSEFYRRAVDAELARMS